MSHESAGKGDAEPQSSRRISRGRHGLGSLVLFVVVFGLALRPDQPALAYLDPGSGAILLQMLLGGVAGFLVVLKLYWHRFVKLLRFKRKDPEAAVPPPPK